MLNCLRKCIPLLLAGLLFFAPAARADYDVRNDIDLAAAESVPSDARDLLGDIGVEDAPGFGEGLAEIFTSGLEQSGGSIRAGVRSVVVILLIVIFCGVLTSLYPDGKTPRYIVLAGALAITALTVADLRTFIGLGLESIRQADIFSKGLLATLATAAAIGGEPASATVRHTITILFSDILITAISRFLVPVLYAYTAASAADAAIGGDTLSRLANFLKWLCTAALGVLLTVFVAYLTISGVVAGNADALAVKATKLTLSGMVPVIGGIIGDAAETLLVGARQIKNAIGVFGMLVVLATMFAPFLRLAVQYILFKAAAAVSQTLADARLTKLVDNLGSAFGIMLGMMGAVMLLFLISIVSTISIVAPG
ncbi:stage III sporulation protein AE [Oscillospiraceae bacterium OttesenSCG-928-G22]|nr:stage III sporulation protein AE [Oscillospiraceae bacterium OttesenSCG-928-G22]